MPAEIRSKPFPCWNCEYPLDTHINANPTDTTPITGGLAICIQCGAANTFIAEDGQITDMRVPTPQEWHEYTTNAEVLSAMYGLIIFKEETE